MTFALVLVLLVEARDAGDPATKALSDTIGEALGPDATVEVHTREELADPHVDDDTLTANERAADGIVVLQWTSPMHTVARIAVRSGTPAHWSERAVVFETVDVPREKGRTLGFAAASMLPSASPTPSPSSPPKKEAPPPSVLGNDRVEPHDAGSPPPSFSPTRISRFGIYVGGGATVGIGGAGTSFGGTVAFEWMALPRLTVDGGGSMAFGQIDEVQATSLDFELASGARFDVVRSQPKHRWGLAVRTGALVVHQSLSHFSSDDVHPDRQSRWVPGLFGQCEGSWAVSSYGSAIVLRVGAEMLAGRIDVYSHERLVTHVSPLRATGQLGLRVHF